MKSTALILTQSPFSNSLSHDALDMAMVLGTFEIPTALFFVSGAVSQFVALKPEILGIKNYVKSFAALPFYDVTDLYVCREDLLSYNISEENLTDNFQLLNKQEIREKLQSYHQVITF